MRASLSRLPGRAAIAALIAALFAGAAPARADDLQVSYRRDLPIIIGGGALYFLGEAVFKDDLAPGSCRWCRSNGFDDALRDHLRWDATDRANTLSNLTGFVVAPVFAIGAVSIAARVEGRGRDWLDDGLIVVEAVVIASDVNYLIKAAVGRERPFVHALDPADKPNTDHPEDNNESFYSGHSMLGTTLAVSAGYVAMVRGSRWTPVIWAGGLGLAVTTGYLRMAADKHWASDVVTGWVTGAAIGYLVPHLLHHRADPGAVDLAITPRSIQLSVVW